jgi:uncharacterized membrane protein YczE
MIKKLARLCLGILLFSIGIMMTVKAQIGYAPWDTFHYGLSTHIGLSYGVTAILVGAVTVAIALILGEQIGIGTLLNMTLIGIFCDLIIKYNLIKTPSSFTLSVLMLILGLVIMSFASFFYISAGLGAGPRDSLMVALNKKLNLPIGICRNIIEISVLLTGWLLGGAVGVGTLLSAILMGLIVQVTFKWLKFDARSVRQENIAETLRFKKISSSVEPPIKIKSSSITP